MSFSTPHTRKRPYQPSISSYFHRAPSSSSTHSQAISPLSPSLPAETQASLLSVGMRVRKSIPEGYKTHKTLGASSFPFPSSAPAERVREVRPMYYTEHSRELAPWCAIHKIGGYAAQPSRYNPPPSSAPGRLSSRSTHDDLASTIPTFSSSQSTLASSQSSITSSSSFEAPSSKKRTYEEEVEEVEEDMDNIVDEMEAKEAYAVAPKRPMAKARGVPRKPVLTERVGVVDDDFEEAPFLVPMDVGM